jgi:hypothetical protein
MNLTREEIDHVKQAVRRLQADSARQARLGGTAVGDLRLPARLTLLLQSFKPYQGDKTPFKVYFANLKIMVLLVTMHTES